MAAGSGLLVVDESWVLVKDVSEGEDGLTTTTTMRLLR
jgi:hypothetical protein